MLQLTDVRALRALRRWSVPEVRRPLLSAAFRLAAVLLAAAGAAVMTLLAIRYADHTKPGGLDRTVDGRLRSGLAGYRGGLTLMAHWAPLVVAVLGAALLVACVLTRRPRAAVLVAVVLPAGLLADVLLKRLIHRTIFGFLSFPSGHTIGTFSLAIITAVLLLGPHRPPLRPVLRVLLSGTAVVIACVVMVALVVARMHYFTDTIGGAALATFLVLGTALLIDLIAGKSRVAAPGPAC